MGVAPTYPVHASPKTIHHHSPAHQPTAQSHIVSPQQPGPPQSPLSQSHHPPQASPHGTPYSHPGITVNQTSRPPSREQMAGQIRTSHAGQIHGLHSPQQHPAYEGQSFRHPYQPQIQQPGMITPQHVLSSPRGIATSLHRPHVLQTQVSSAQQLLTGQSGQIGNFFLLNKF